MVLAVETVAASTTATLLTATTNLRTIRKTTNKKFSKQKWEEKEQYVYNKRQNNEFAHEMTWTQNSPDDQGSISGRFILKTQKMILDVALLSTQHYKMRVKLSNPGNGLAPSPTLRCRSYWKRKPSGRPRLRSPTYLYENEYRYNEKEKERIGYLVSELNHYKWIKQIGTKEIRDWSWLNRKCDALGIVPEIVIRQC